MDINKSVLEETLEMVYKLLGDGQTDKAMEFIEDAWKLRDIPVPVPVTKLEIIGFTNVDKELPKKTQEVEVVVNGNICKCMFFNEKSNFFPKGFFGTFYKMVIDNVTHWKEKPQTK